jgi:hypothetical protein
LASSEALGSPDTTRISGQTQQSCKAGMTHRARLVLRAVKIARPRAYRARSIGPSASRRGWKTARSWVTERSWRRESMRPTAFLASADRKARRPRNWMHTEAKDHTPQPRTTQPSQHYTPLRNPVEDSATQPIMRKAKGLTVGAFHFTKPSVEPSAPLDHTTTRSHRATAPPPSSALDERRSIRPWGTAQPRALGE